MKKMGSLFVIFLLSAFLSTSTCPAFGGSIQGQDEVTKTTAKQAKASSEPALDDAGIVVTIKEKFAKSNLTKDAAIEVDVKDGVVTLRGKVQHGYQKGGATRMAKTVHGVKSVSNLIEVEKAAGSGSSSKGK
ncbi:MAG: BON domain-containing protein [Acidobacteriia bacterium]|nr:BON domain-containing protein [Terriglobia bacterium]